MTWPGGAEVASQVGVGGGARAGSAAGPAACAETARPEMAAPGLRLCAAAAPLLLLLLLRLPLRARADEHEHTVRRVPASPGGAATLGPQPRPPRPPRGGGPESAARRAERGAPGRGLRWGGWSGRGGGPDGRRAAPTPRGFFPTVCAVIWMARGGFTGDRVPFCLNSV